MVGGLAAVILPLPAATPILEINRVETHAVRLAWPTAERNWVVEGGTDMSRMATVLTAPQFEGDRIALTLAMTEPAFFWHLRALETSGVPGGRNFLRDSQVYSGAWGMAGEIRALHTTAALDALIQLAGTDPSFEPTIQFGLDAVDSM